MEYHGTQHPERPHQEKPLPKHVVALNGSPRKALTQQRLEEIAALLAPHDIEVEILSLRGREIKECTGCETCMRRISACVQSDDAADILGRLQAADGIILASPVYLVNVPGKLKSLIDKTAGWVHRPPLVGKPALLLATTGGAGLKAVLRYLQDVVVQWGAQPAGSIGRKITDQRPVQAAEVAQFVWHLDHDPEQYRPSLRQVAQYQVQKVLAMKVSKLDRAYWSERGWDRAPYYYPRGLGWGKRLLGGIMYRILDWRIQPVHPF